MDAHPMRLQPGAEIKSFLLDFVARHKIEAAFILTCCGSVSKACLRFATDEQLSHKTVSCEWTINKPSNFVRLVKWNLRLRIFGKYFHLIFTANRYAYRMIRYNNPSELIFDVFIILLVFFFVLLGNSEWKNGNHFFSRHHFQRYNTYSPSYHPR